MECAGSNPLQQHDFGRRTPQPGAESGAVGAQNPTVDPDLAEVVARWPALPEATRQAVVAMVKAARADFPPPSCKSPAP